MTYYEGRAHKTVTLCEHTNVYYSLTKMYQPSTEGTEAGAEPSASIKYSFKHVYNKTEVKSLGFHSNIAVLQLSSVHSWF